jgi:putative flippase GtrA
MLDLINPRYLRYLAVSLLCATTNNIILIVGDHLGFGYVELTILTFVLTNSGAYFLHSRFTFRRRSGVSNYWRFMAGGAFAVPLAIALLAIMCSVWGLPMIIAAPVQTVLMVIYNYLNARFAITSSPLSDSMSVVSARR